MRIIVFITDLLAALMALRRGDLAVRLALLRLRDVKRGARINPTPRT